MAPLAAWRATGKNNPNLLLFAGERTNGEGAMTQEKDLERQRAEIVEAMDWIDAERKRLSRFCFSETRKKWHGERERGRQITLMKKQGEWLYRRRCRLREQIGSVNAALKELRRARNGRVSESFASIFVETARERLPDDVFAGILDQAAKHYGGHEAPGDATKEHAASTTVLHELKHDLAAFMESNRPPELRRRTSAARETQADFRVADISDSNRVCPAYAR